MAAGEHFAEAGGDEGIGGGDIAVFQANHGARGWGRDGGEAVPLTLPGLVGDGVAEADENGVGVGGGGFPKPFEGGGCGRGGG